MTNNLSNFSLFIPRQQNMVSASLSQSVDSMTPPVISGLARDPLAHTTGTAQIGPHHLEEVLRENFLAIQNWANRRGTSCSVRGSTAETFPYNASATLSFDTKTWDYYNLASTSAQTVTVPAAGIYTVSAGVAMTHIPGAAQVQIAMNPGTYPAQSGYVAGSTSLNWNTTFGGNLQKFNGGESLSIAAFGVFGTTDAALMQLKEFTLTKLFDVPSAVQ